MSYILLTCAFLSFWELGTVALVFQSKYPSKASGLQLILELYFKLTL